MDPSKVLTAFAVSETDNKNTITVLADVAGNKAGTNFTFGAIDSNGVSFSIRPFSKVGGSGSDPALGYPEIDLITHRADVAGNYASTYYLVHDGPVASEVDYYVYHTVAGAGYDPKLGLPVISRVTPSAYDVGLASEYFVLTNASSVARHVWFDASPEFSVDPAVGAPQVITIQFYADVPPAHLNGKYFLISSTTTDYYVWYSDGAGVDPLIPGRTAVPVTFIDGETAALIAADTKAALDLVAGAPFVTDATTTTFYTITNAVKGPALHAPGVGNTGFTMTLVHDGVTQVPALGLGIPVGILPGWDENQMANAIADAINAYYPQDFSAAVSATNDVVITNVTGGNVTAATDGNTGFTFATDQAGVNPVALLATYSLLGVVDVGLGDTNVAVAAATASVLNKVPGWSCVQQAGGNNMKTLLIHKTKGLTTSTSDGDVGGAWAVVVTPGVNATGDISVPVVYAQNATANQVGAAMRAALISTPFLTQLFTVSGANDSVVITSRWKGVVAACADAAAPYATGYTFAVVPPGYIAGTVVTSSDMSVDGSVTPASFAIKPGVKEVNFLRKMNLFITGVANMANFGSLGAPLANGCLLRVLNLDGTVNKLIATIKTNAELAALGNFYVDAAGNLVVNMDLAQAFGNELSVSGILGQKLEWLIQDNIAAVAMFTAGFQGHQIDNSLLSPPIQTR